MEKIENDVVYLTNQEFKDKVFNYNESKEWKYEGKLPAIIDFYADWCGPCKMIAPILKEIANEYSGKLIVYKVNTETERELASAFGISSIPTLLFVPVSGPPQAAKGAMPRNAFDNAIHEILLKNSK
jgi:thioredoxin 1